MPRVITVPDAGFISARSFDQPPVVMSVRPDGDAARAGLAVGDILISINGQTGANARAATSDIDSRIVSMHPGETVTVKIRNRQGEHELRWKLGSREETEYEVKDLASVSPAQRARRSAWLKGEVQTEAMAKTSTSSGAQP